MFNKLDNFNHIEFVTRRWCISIFRQSKLLFYTWSHSKYMNKYISRFFGKPGFVEMPNITPTVTYHIARNVLSLISYGYTTTICIHILIHSQKSTHFECVFFIFWRFVYWILHLRYEIVGRNLNISYIDDTLLPADLKRKRIKTPRDKMIGEIYPSTTKRQNVSSPAREKYENTSYDLGINI